MIDAAIAAGVKLFFTNEFVGDIASPRYQRMPEAFVGAKVRIRRDLEMLASEGKISWTSLNGGPFFDMCRCSHCPVFSPDDKSPVVTILMGFGEGGETVTIELTFIAHKNRADEGPCWYLGTRCPRLHLRHR